MFGEKATAALRQAAKAMLEAKDGTEFELRVVEMVQQVQAECDERWWQEYFAEREGDDEPHINDDVEQFSVV